jgi:exosortase/archaeosortase family protein
MFRKYYISYKELRAGDRYGPIIDLLNFVVLILAIHFLYDFFTAQFDYIIHRIFGIYDWFNVTVYKQCKFFLSYLVPVKSEGQKFIFANKDSIDILFPCTGVQPMLQFALLLFLYPGPWKHKAWYIPMGMVIIHLTNVFRITGLGIVMAYWPQHWYYAHDYPFRIIVYIVIFILWVVWNDKFYHRKSKSGTKQVVPGDK